MSESIPVNPDILQWARKSAGLSIDDVVAKIKRKRVTYETISGWEAGVESPTYPQLERLAYEIYKRPLAVFFFPDPPDEITPKQSFRTLLEYEISSMPPTMRILLRRARAFQLNLYELYDDVNPAKNKILKDLSFEPNISAVEMGAIVREYLSIDINRQSSFGNPENALKEWRSALEKVGLFVFKDAFKSDDFSGFCLYDEKFPIIYVNNSKPFTRQIFTLFHELSHLLFKTGGIDTNLEDYIGYLQGENQQIEVICNSFAGEFLVPSDDFNKRIGRLSIDDSSVSELATIYNVSREVILRKLLDRELIDGQYYEERVRSWKNQYKEKKKKRKKEVLVIITTIKGFIWEVSISKKHLVNIIRIELLPNVWLTILMQKLKMFLV